MKLKVAAMQKLKQSNAVKSLSCPVHAKGMILISLSFLVTGIEKRMRLEIGIVPINEHYSAMTYDPKSFGFPPT